MKYSLATEYALHTLLYLTLEPEGTYIGIEQLAESLNLSPTNLSKTLTKLVKAGLIESSTGVKGGYRLGRQSHISLLDVIHAIEGKASLFNCTLENEFFNKIEYEMIAAEKKMKDALSKIYFVDIMDQRNKVYVISKDSEETDDEHFLNKVKQIVNLRSPKEKKIVLDMLEMMFNHVDDLRNTN